jgi:hypothetical protein
VWFTPPTTLIVNLCIALCLLQPLDLEQGPPMQPINSSAHIDPVLIFRAYERGVFTMQMLLANGIVREVNVPEFITKMQEMLQAKRSIDTKQKV